MLPTLESLVFCLRSSDALSVAADSLSFLNMRPEHFLSINFPIIVNFSFTIKCNFIQSKKYGGESKTSTNSSILEHEVVPMHHHLCLERHWKRKKSR